MHESGSESIDNFRESAYWIDFKIINVLTSYLKYIREKLNEVSSDFEFLSQKKVIFYNDIDLQEAATDSFLNILTS